MRWASRNSESILREPEPRSGAGTAFFLACLIGALHLPFPASAEEPALNRLSAEEAAQGFELLFDGTYASFHAHFVDYKQNDSTSDSLGVKHAYRTDPLTGLSSLQPIAWWSVDTAVQALVSASSGGGPDARSRRKFRDFDFRVEYRCDGTQGFYYRTLLTEDRAWKTGVEYKLWDYTYLNPGNPNPYSLHPDTTGVNKGRYPNNGPGAAYDLYGPSSMEAYPYATGKWNSARIVAIGDSVEHWLNGVKVLGYRYHSPDFWDRYNVSKWNVESLLTNKKAGDRKGGYIEEGYLGIRGDWPGRWHLRNMRINDKHPAFGPEQTSGIVRPRAAAGKSALRLHRIPPTPAFPVDGKTEATLDGKRLPAGTARGRAGR
jgi:hypothetical protein